MNKTSSLTSGHFIIPSASILFAKRIEDLILGFIGTLVFVVTYPVIALIIKLDSKGPVLYSQKRVGINRRDVKSLVRNSSPADSQETLRQRIIDMGGKPFTLYKYRSMRTDSEKNGPQLTSQLSDSRITRVGKWLRLLHLDELPQAWNVLLGNMSFVGPRPERPYFTEQYIKTIPYYSLRLYYVKPGLTGLSQIKLGYDETIESVVLKCQFDVAYAATYNSFTYWGRLELWILFNTIIYLFRRTKSHIRKTYFKGLVDHVEILKDTSDTGVKQHHLSALVTFNNKDTEPLILRGSSLSELDEQIERIDPKETRSIEATVESGERFEIEDLVFFVDLAKRVGSRHGTVSVTNANETVQETFREMHLNNLVRLPERHSESPNLMTVNTDCWFHALNLRKKIPKSEWSRKESRILANVQSVLDLFSSTETRATFFVLGWVADNYPEAVRMIHRAGHEIGTFGYYGNLVYKMAVDEFEADLVKSMEAISKLTGKPVESYRAYNYSIITNHLWPFEILSRHGIRIDSSISPVPRHRYGIRNYPCLFPHTLLTPGGDEIKEFPMSCLTLWGQTFPLGGSSYLRLFPYRFTSHYFNQLNNKGYPGMVYFHPWEFDVAQERVKLDFTASFRHYVNLDSTKIKIYSLLQEFKFTSLADYAETDRCKAFFHDDCVRIETDPPGVRVHRQHIQRGKWPESEAEAENRRPAWIMNQLKW